MKAVEVKGPGPWAASGGLASDQKSVGARPLRLCRRVYTTSCLQGQGANREGDRMKFDTDEQDAVELLVAATESLQQRPSDRSQGRYRLAGQAPQRPATDPPRRPRNHADACRCRWLVD